MNVGDGPFLAARSYRATLCVTGMRLGGLEDKCLDSARYTFTGLSEWLPKGVKESWENDCVLIRVPHNERDVFAMGLRENRIEVTLKVFAELTSSESDDGRLSRSIPFVEIASANPECLSWYRNIGNRLENLFSLLTGASVALETLFVYRGKESAHIIEKRIRHVKPFSQLECVRCTTSELATGIAIWLSEPQRFRSVESLALGVIRKGKLFLETEFLSLAQALEGFHRATTTTTVSDRATFRQARKKIVKLLMEENVDAALAQRICESMSHANEMTFASRLSHLCSLIGESLLTKMNIRPEQFVDEVRVTRNFYTHAGGNVRRSGARNLAEGLQLFLLNQKMRALLRGVMLLHLRIPEDRFQDLLVREATRWR
jgi:hypothetical protein